MTHLGAIEAALEEHYEQADQAEMDAIIAEQIETIRRQDNHILFLRGLLTDATAWATQISNRCGVVYMPVWWTRAKELEFGGKNGTGATKPSGKDTDNG